MRKKDELTNPKGCMSRARDDEMTFVLLGRDAAAPATIAAWVWERVRLGKNTVTDPQIVEALECAETMERERNGSASPPPSPTAWPTPSLATLVRVQCMTTKDNLLNSLSDYIRRCRPGELAAFDVRILDMLARDVERKLATLAPAERCGFVPPTPGYAPCTRAKGHDGPCAHDLAGGTNQ
jgi:hypothetical protein